MRCSITGTTTSPSARCSSIGGERRLGVELRLHDGRRRHAQPDAQVDEAPGVEQRGGDDDGAAGADRARPRQQRRQRAEAARAAARRALRPAGRARRQDHLAADVPRRRERHRRALLGRASPARCRTRSSTPRQPATIGANSSSWRIGVDALVGDDVGELRPGEPGVQVDDVGAELGGGDDALHEARGRCGRGCRPCCPAPTPRRAGRGRCRRCRTTGRRTSAVPSSSMTAGASG